LIWVNGLNRAKGYALLKTPTQALLQPADSATLATARSALLKTSVFGERAAFLALPRLGNISQDILAGGRCWHRWLRAEVFR
jgi:hypothetical protein